MGFAAAMSVSYSTLGSCLQAPPTQHFIPAFLMTSNISLTSDPDPLIILIALPLSNPHLLRHSKRADVIRIPYLDFMRLVSALGTLSPDMEDGDLIRDDEIETGWAAAQSVLEPADVDPEADFAGEEILVQMPREAPGM